MGKLRFEWTPNIFRQIRTDPKVVAEVKRRAHKIADRAGDGYAVRSNVTRGRGRARSVVLPITAEAAADNAENNTLLRSLDAGRD